MRIVLTSPTINGRHGGVRIIYEWATRLAAIGHHVSIFNERETKCDWYDLKGVKIVSRLPEFDTLIICSPHHINLQSRVKPHQRCFIFCQMMEHLFRSNDRGWNELCKQFYCSKYPMFSISQWNIEMMKELGRTGETHYIGNGVNLNDFPISDKPKDGKTILVEGWEASNPSKDVEHIAPKVAARLKAEGYYIIAYSALPLKTMPDVPHEYHVKPSLEKLNELYERATIMLKATKFDARSCAPVEAMTKGTVTARAIQKGDDDLMDGINCMRGDYNEHSLYTNAKLLLTEPKLREELAQECLRYVQEELDWNKIMIEVNEILCR